MTIRVAKESDAPSLVALLSSLGYPNTEDFVRSKLNELSSVPTSKTIVATIDEEVVGFLHFDSQLLFHQEGRIGCIMALCVSDDRRGAGVGKALVAEAERIAREQGCIKVSVASGLQRLGAHSFYRSLGYEETTKRFVKVF